MLRSWGGSAWPCDLGAVSWASTTLSAKGKGGHSPVLSLPLLGDAPSGASACQGPPCPHRNTVQPGWGLNTHLSLMGQCTKRPEGLTRTAPSYPCHYWGCEQLSHLALGHPEVSLKRTHQAGALGPWQGPLLQVRVPTQVREGENGHPVCWGGAGHGCTSWVPGAWRTLTCNSQSAANPGKDDLPGVSLMSCLYLMTGSWWGGAHGNAGKPQNSPT